MAFSLSSSTLQTSNFPRPQYFFLFNFSTLKTCPKPHCPFDAPQHSISKSIFSCSALFLNMYASLSCFKVEPVLLCKFDPRMSKQVLFHLVLLRTFSVWCLLVTDWLLYFLICLALLLFILFIISIVFLRIFLRSS